MSQQAREHDARRAPRGTAQRSKRIPQQLGDCAVGDLVTVRLRVTGNGSDGWRFVRPVDAAGQEGEPLHLPGWWPVEVAS